MNTKRKIEVFSAGCPACEETIKLVNSMACPSCEVVVSDMNDPSVASRANSLGIRCVPYRSSTGRWRTVARVSAPTRAPYELPG